NRRFDELVVIGRVNVVGAHALENSAEEAELPERIPDRRACAGPVEDQSGLYRDERQGRACRRTEQAERRPAHHLQTSLFCRLREWIYRYPAFAENQRRDDANDDQRRSRAARLIAHHPPIASVNGQARLLLERPP